MQEITLRNSAEANRRDLQAALDRGGEIAVTGPGTFEVAGTLRIAGGTKLVFAPGVILRRTDGNGLHFLENRGAETGERDRGITVEGLHLEVGDCDLRRDLPHPGWRGQLMLLHVEDLVLRNFICTDVGEYGYAVLISAFRNVLVENVRIEGKKDGVHFGPGRDLVLRNGVFRTWDDPVALNAYDYYSSSPEFGWIENALVENCTELPAAPGTPMMGYFCRLLGGGWGEWRRGMQIQRSDLAVHEGRLYSCGLAAGDVRASTVPPTHETGVAEAGGIPWRRVAGPAVRDAGCRNITFRNIRLQKDRPCAFGAIYDWNRFGRSIYPDSPLPVFDRIVFEDIRVEAAIPKFLALWAACRKLEVRDSDLRGGVIEVRAAPGVSGPYPSDPPEIVLSGNVGGPPEIRDSRGGGSRI